MKAIFQKNLQFGDIWHRNHQKIAQTEVFGHFLDFTSLVFLDFAHIDRWAWCLVVFLQFADPVNVFSLLEILMLVVQIDGNTTFLIKQVEKQILSHHQDTKIIDKPTFVKNNSISCNGLIFCTNQKVISEYSADASIFDKCHKNISLIARLTSAYPSHQNMSIKYGTTVKQILKISKNLSKTLIGVKLMNPFLQIKKLEF